MTTECPCPFCPLVAFNIQTCDVHALVVRKKMKTTVSLAIPPTVMEGRTDADAQLIRKCFSDLAVWAEGNMKQRKMSVWNSEDARSIVTVDRRKNELKICFHAKVVEEDPTA